MTTGAQADLLGKLMVEGVGNVSVLCWEHLLKLSYHRLYLCQLSNYVQAHPAACVHIHAYTCGHMCACACACVHADLLGVVLVLTA